MIATNLKFIKNDKGPIGFVLHRIHPYTAKLIPEIPRYVIENYTNSDDLVLDPFCGSGTSLLEARLLHRRAVGIDINPLAVLISKVKTSNLDVVELAKAITKLKQLIRITHRGPIPDFPNIEYWFSKSSQQELARIKYAIESISDHVSEESGNFLLLCFSSIIRKSSFADPYLSMCKSKLITKKIEDGWLPKPIVSFEDALDKRFRWALSLNKFIGRNGKKVRVHQGDNGEILRKFSPRSSGKFDLIITSPPYINAHDYFRNHRMELLWAGLSTVQDIARYRKKSIGATFPRSKGREISETRSQTLNNLIHRLWKQDQERCKTVHNYFEQMDKFLKQCRRILRSNGVLCMVTGDNTICGIKIPTYKILAEVAEFNGFHLTKVFKDKIRRSTLAPERNYHKGLIRKEWILILRSRRSI